MNKKVIELLIVGLCTVLFVHTSAAVQQGGAQLQKPAGKGASFIFDNVAPVLRRVSRVPLRLPQFLPDVDKQHPIHAIIQSKSTSSYSILLAVEVPCEGENNCTYGSVEGAVSPFPPSGKRTVPIKLQKGITGEFVKSVCHAYCSEAYVRWKEEGFYYSIGIKGEEMQTMIKVANSAIDSGHIEGH